MAAPAATELAQFAKLIRPFPVKRLHDRVLYQLLATSVGIQKEADKLLYDQPRSVEEWSGALHRISMATETLEEICREVRPQLALLMDQAEGDHRRGLDAVVAMMRGLAAEATS